MNISKSFKNHENVEIVKIAKILQLVEMTKARKQIVEILEVFKIIGNVEFQRDLKTDTTCAACGVYICKHCFYDYHQKLKLIKI